MNGTLESYSRISVHNLPYSATKQQVTALFGPFGRIASLRLKHVRVHTRSLSVLYDMICFVFFEYIYDCIEHKNKLRKLTCACACVVGVLLFYLNFFSSVNVYLLYTTQGYAFVEFESSDSAAAAMNTKQPVCAFLHFHFMLIQLSLVQMELMS